MAELPLTLPCFLSGTADSDWVTVNHDFVVPATMVNQFTGEVDVPAEVAMVLFADETASGGKAWFANASMSQTNLLPTAHVQDLPETIDAAAGVPSATPADVDARLAGLTPGTGEIRWVYSPDLRAMVAVAVTGLTGLQGTDFVVTDAEGSFNTIRSASTSNAGQIASIHTMLANLQAQINASSGRAFTDEFERTSAVSLGSDWAQYDSGSGAGILCTSNGHDALVDSRSGTRYCMAVWDGADTQTVTDYQTVNTVLSSVINSNGYVDLLARVNTSTPPTDYLRLRVFYHGFAELHRINSSTPTLIDNLTEGSGMWTPTNVTLFAGNPTAADPDIYQVRYDNQIVMSGTDAGIPGGAGYRGAGFAMGFTGGSAPGALNYWTAFDTSTLMMS